MANVCLPPAIPTNITSELSSYCEPADGTDSTNVPACLILLVHHITRDINFLLSTFVCLALLKTKWQFVTSFLIAVCLKLSSLCAHGMLVLNVDVPLP